MFPFVVLSSCTGYGETHAHLYTALSFILHTYILISYRTTFNDEDNIIIMNTTIKLSLTISH